MSALLDIEALSLEFRTRHGTVHALEAVSVSAGRGATAEESAWVKELASIQEQLAKLQGDTPLVHAMVDRQAVAAVVSGWTGIPVGKMVLDEIKTVLTLRDRLEERVIGQRTALEAVAERMKTARASP